MRCPKCGCAVAVKNGIVQGKQRYKCKSCGCNYTQSTMSRTPKEQRVAALKLYLEGVGFRGIERLTGTPHTTVISWVSKLGEDIERLRPQNGGAVNIMELDELWHFVKKSPTSSGSGLPMIEMGSKSMP